MRMSLSVKFTFFKYGVSLQCYVVGRVFFIIEVLLPLYGDLIIHIKSYIYLYPCKKFSVQIMLETLRVSPNRQLTGPQLSEREYKEIR